MFNIKSINSNSIKEGFKSMILEIRGQEDIHLHFDWMVQRVIYDNLEGYTFNQLSTKSIIKTNVFYLINGCCIKFMFYCLIAENKKYYTPIF
ncbi:hypothetical protein BpHYR1_025627 [Brachionus plicatilis]|uniref:Uncharacterized protein n=1 Tax=Brachionus plicatilis TaxID=10195 RepID=A0A3M7STU6_BRAPC|nr:hypothetical protein BpHYR1_025627 [Brachionus plicatilis]